jgi:hypothetical protein
VRCQAPLACQLAALTGRRVPPLPAKAALKVGVEVAWGLARKVAAALRVLHEMATFSVAGVTDMPPPGH